MEYASMNMRISPKTHLALALSLTALFSVTEAAAATTYVTSCGQSIPAGSPAVLDADLVYNGAMACLQLPNGVSLNTSTFTITCQAGYTCGQAVKCLTGGLSNVIQSTVNNDTITNVSGSFTTAIHNCSTVRNLKIVGATTAILYDDSSTNGDDYTGNVIEVTSGGAGISVKVEESGDLVSDNRITGGDYGIRLLSGRNQSSGPYIRENIIRGFADAGIYSTVTSSDYFRITKNTMINGLPGSVAMDIAGTNGVYTDNICEDATGTTAGRCECDVDNWDLTTVGDCPF